jgi:hypothetical protein
MSGGMMTAIAKLREVADLTCASIERNWGRLLAPRPESYDFEPLGARLVLNKIQSAVYRHILLLTYAKEHRYKMQLAD